MSTTQNIGLILILCFNKFTTRLHQMHNNRNLPSAGISIPHTTIVSYLLCKTPIQFITTVFRQNSKNVLAPAAACSIHHTIILHWGKNSKLLRTIEMLEENVNCPRYLGKTSHLGFFPEK